MNPTGESRESGRAARRASHTRKKLLDAALSVFTEVGLDACTIEDITERADVGKGTFYRHFEDKYALLSSLVENAQAEMLSRFRGKPADCKSLDDALAHVLDAQLSFFATHPNVFVFLFEGRLLSKMHHGTASPEHSGLPLVSEIEKWLTPWVPQPPDPVKVRRLACAAVGFVSGFFSVGMMNMKQDEMEAGIEPLRRAFLAGARNFVQ